MTATGSPFGIVEERLVAFDRQMRGQQSDGGQRDVAVRETAQDRRKPPRRAGGGDAAVRGRLRKMKHVRAVREQRRMAFGELELARIEFAEQGQKLGRRAPIDVDEAASLDEQFTIGQASWCSEGHESVVARDSRRRLASP